MKGHQNNAILLSAFTHSLPTTCSCIYFRQEVVRQSSNYFILSPNIWTCFIVSNAEINVTKQNENTVETNLIVNLLIISDHITHNQFLYFFINQQSFSLLTTRRNSFFILGRNTLSEKIIHILSSLFLYFLCQSFSNLFSFFIIIFFYFSEQVT